MKTRPEYREATKEGKPKSMMGSVVPLPSAIWTELLEITPLLNVLSLDRRNDECRQLGRARKNPPLCS
jgi:hypothetical protein